MSKTDDYLPTRWSLLSRLKDVDDREGWREFFETYRDLIFAVAKKAGLTDTEAEEAVQETLITVAKKMPEFQTNPEAGSFKGWLLNTTRWKVTDQFRRRKPDQIHRQHRRPGDSLGGTGTLERLPDEEALQPEEIWDEEWKRNLFNLALRRVEQRTKAKHYQIFYLNVVKDTPGPKVADQLGVSAAQVYIVKHRLSAALKKEVRKLEKELAQ